MSVKNVLFLDTEYEVLIENMIPSRLYTMFSDELIREINKVFHEVESEDYDESHPEILRDERNNWSNLAKLIFPSEIKKGLYDAT